MRTALKEKYSKKLELENCTLPDSFKLETGWMEEEDGIAYWPIIPVKCILNFLMINNDITGMSDYKASKGYSYSKQGWLGKISYRAIGSENCFLRVDCRPSSRLRDPPHKLSLYIVQIKWEYFKRPSHLHDRHGFNL